MAEGHRGAVIDGRYRLLAELGSGGFGRVWKARDERLGVDVAIKELKLPASVSAAERTELLTRAAREARNAAVLRDHPNIAGVHDVVVEDGVPWIVMRLVGGHSLDWHLAKHKRLSVAQTGRLAVALLDALEAAARVGIVHRDVKPANILLGTAGETVLTDFGIAVNQADTVLTASGVFIGSMEYVAPERARGEDATAASDLFSLGVTLYEAIEGVSPFRRSSVAATLSAVILEEPPEPSRAGRLVPLIMGLLDKDPAGRPTIAEARKLVRAPERAPAEPAGRPPADRRTETPAATLVEQVPAAKTRPPSRWAHVCWETKASGVLLVVWAAVVAVSAWAFHIDGRVVYGVWHDWLRPENFVLPRPENHVERAISEFVQRAVLVVAVIAGPVFTGAWAADEVESLVVIPLYQDGSNPLHDVRNLLRNRRRAPWWTTLTVSFLLGGACGIIGVPAGVLMADGWGAPHRTALIGSMVVVGLVLWLGGYLGLRGSRAESR